MKTATILAALAGTVLATEQPTRIKQRQVSAVASVVATVSGDLTSLDSAVKAWNGGDPSPVQDASATLIDDINAGAESINGIQPLSVNDALSLQEPSTALSGASQTLVDDLVAKKSQFEQAGLCSTIRDNVGQINTATQTLVKNVVAKLPTEVQAIAQTILGQVQGSLDQGNAAFAEGNCTDATGGGGSSSGSGSSSTASGGGSASGSATASVTATVGPTGGPSATSSAAGGSGYPTASASATATGGGSGGSGNSTASATPPVVTAAAAHIAGPVGLAAALFAALL